MRRQRSELGRHRFLVLAVAMMGALGCRTFDDRASHGPLPLPQSLPRELSKVVLPEYSIEPPDILTIEGINVAPKAPYFLQTLDVLVVDAVGSPPEAPITGGYTIEPGGAINLGPPYGSVMVVGLPIDQAEERISQHLSNHLADPSVSVSIGQLAASQDVFGEFLVGPDGKITLGGYGQVSVVGKTLQQAKADIEAHLSDYLESPKIALDVYAYNSKVYYIIVQGAGLGDGVYRFPVTGNETVLDAIAQIQGLQQVSSKKIWIARPSEAAANPTILPVDWYSITERGAVDTNYQVLPGDRVFISEDNLIALDTHLAKFTAPFERIMGFSLLGVGTVTRFSGQVLGGGGSPGGFGGFGAFGGF